MCIVYSCILVSLLDVQTRIMVSFEVCKIKKTVIVTYCSSLPYCCLFSKMHIIDLRNTSSLFVRDSSDETHSLKKGQSLSARKLQILSHVYI